MKSKLIKRYVDKGNGAFFIRATRSTDNGFILKDDNFGKALSPNSSNEELGKWVREVLKNCD